MKFTLKDGKRLEGFGYIARSDRLEDRRTRAFRLTMRGRAAYSKTCARSVDRARRIQAGQVNHRRGRSIAGVIDLVSLPWSSMRTLRGSSEATHGGACHSS